MSGDSVFHEHHVHPHVLLEPNELDSSEQELIHPRIWRMNNMMNMQVQYKYSTNKLQTSTLILFTWDFPPTQYRSILYPPITVPSTVPFDRTHIKRLLFDLGPYLPPP